MSRGKLRLSPGLLGSSLKPSFGFGASAMTLALARKDYDLRLTDPGIQARQINRKPGV